jgi:hypothetical protein
MAGRSLSMMAQDVRWGLRIMLSAAAVFSAFVVLLVIAGQGQGIAAKYGITGWQIVGLYFGTGAIVGFLLGLARPLTSTRIGATWVGAGLGAVVFVVMNPAMGLSLSHPVAWIVILTGAGIGAHLAYKHWEPTTPARSPRDAA